MKYYYAEHQVGYQRLRETGRSQWSEVFEEGRPHDFDTFPNRAFLEHALPRLGLPAPAEVDVLEYGCGTGPAACFLAGRGFRVEAVDLIPEAITLARRFAQERDIDVAFGVQDICALATTPVDKRYDLILDSFCLQSIVTDADRASVFAAVHARLKGQGYYLISTAMYEPERSYGPGFRYDTTTGICYQEVPLGQSSEDAVDLGGTTYRPYRRHLTAGALRDELVRAGFDVVAQEGRVHGDLICVRSDRDG